MYVAPWTLNRSSIPHSELRSPHLTGTLDLSPAAIANYQSLTPSHRAMSNHLPPGAEAALRTVPLHDAVLTDFLQGIRSVRPQISRLLLFGSRARGDYRTDSDYDVLVVVGRKSPALLDALYESVLDVLLAHGRLVSLKIFEEREFDRLQGLGTPFARRVAAEGQPLG